MTRQEKLWQSSFGDDYIKRNDMSLLPSRIALFAKILNRTTGVESALEFGANIGINILAIQQFKNIECGAVEINKAAVRELKKVTDDIFVGSIFDYPEKKYDLVFTSGLLIHIHPEQLEAAYRKIYDCSKKYIMINEYYNPHPVELVYRGLKSMMFKRDFAGEMLDMLPIKLVDYGFTYHRDNNFPGDDLNWFLFEL